MSGVNHGERRRQNGRNAEDYIAKFFKARPSYDEAFDLETKNLLIEVKSCDAWSRSGKRGYQTGRFCIDKANHGAFKRLADAAHKKPAYIFVVKIRGQYIFRTMAWEELVLPSKKVCVHLNWSSVFR